MSAVWCLERQLAQAAKKGRGSRPCGLSDGKGKVCHDQLGKVEIWEEFFGEKLNAKKWPLRDVEVESCPCDLVPPAFFVALMGKARAVCKRGKAAGPDGVVVEALELLPPEAMQAVDAMA
eukprot:10024467-Lingulodinium_polyedra.AAC.1